MHFVLVPRQALWRSLEVLRQRDDWYLTDELDYEHGSGDPFAAAVRATRMPIVINDPVQKDNPIVFCNVAFQELTGYAREELVPEMPYVPKPPFGPPG